MFITQKQCIVSRSSKHDDECLDDDLLDMTDRPEIIIDIADNIL